VRALVPAPRCLLWISSALCRERIKGTGRSNGPMSASRAESDLRSSASFCRRSATSSHSLIHSRTAGIDPYRTFDFLKGHAKVDGRRRHNVVVQGRRSTKRRGYWEAQLRGRRLERKARCHVLSASNLHFEGQSMSRLRTRRLCFRRATRQAEQGQGAHKLGKRRSRPGGPERTIQRTVGTLLLQRECHKCQEKEEAYRRCGSKPQTSAAPKIPSSRFGTKTSSDPRPSR